MPLVLSDQDLVKLQQTVNLLISPLSASSVDQWRSDVCAKIKSLFDANTTGFILPVPDGPFVYSDDHDREALNAFPELTPPPRADGRNIYQVGCERGVVTMTGVYDNEPDVYFDGAYYNEYALPNHAADTLGLLYAIDAENPWALASLQIWQDERGLFGEREMALGRLLYPAFKAGIQTQLTLGMHKAGLVRMFDELGQSLAVIDVNGRVQHQTPSLVALMVADPQSEMLGDALVNCGMSALKAKDVTAAVTTSHATYEMRSTIYRGFNASGEPSAIVSLTRIGTERRTPRELEMLYGLTPAESNVALLMARGLSNQAIACELKSSPHTIRRHTEKIFFKLNVRSRAQVAAKIGRTAYTP